MHAAASAQQSHGESGNGPAKLAAIGAAFAGVALTIAISTSNPAPISAPLEATPTTTTQCSSVARRLMVSSNGGSGMVRFRAGSYVSPPFILNNRPANLVFPLPRPDTTPVEEVITIEGNATGVVLTSDLTGFRQEFDRVAGSSVFTVKWMPLKTC